MPKDYQSIQQEQAQLAKNYRTAASDVMAAFSQLHIAAMGDGALSSKHKELIAVAIGVAARCDGCIAAHVRAAVRHGASREELIETINVAIMMGGGPSVIYGTQALSAVDEFLK